MIAAASVDANSILAVEIQSILAVRRFYIPRFMIKLRIPVVRGDYL